MSGFFAVSHDYGPFIAQHPDFVAAQGYHRLYRESHVSLDLSALARFAVVWDVRIFVELCAGAVTGVVPDDPHAEALGVLLDRVSDISYPEAFHCVLDAFEEALAGDIDELLILGAYDADRICTRRVAVIALVRRAHIDAHDVSFSELSCCVRYAVDDLFID